MEERRAIVDKKARLAREARVVREKEAAVAAEKKRREQGQKHTESRELMEQMARKKANEDAKKKRAQDKAWKEEVRAKVAADKAARFANKRPAEEGAAPPEQAKSPEAAPAAPKAKKVYDKCTVMIRLLDGSNQKVTFAPSDTVGTVHEHIRGLWGAGMPDGSWALANTFPREVYNSPEAMAKTLLEVGMVPRGALAVQRL
eukprot:TRINITY_DN19361_c0_g1_i2.p2 TRINITY_DN19361_c0_g1~~TRINITY_DN19361_c0_g1_i2.p2  ORF type:complete len:201 (-),score=60.42 TRINITY_DN19361_c0_g1_i2:143-745(-)